MQRVLTLVCRWIEVSASLMPAYWWSVFYFTQALLKAFFYFFLLFLLPLFQRETEIFCLSVHEYQELLISLSQTLVLKHRVPLVCRG